MEIVTVLMVGQGAARFDLAYVLALNPISENLPLYKSPLVLSKGHYPFLLLQRKLWLGTQLGYEGRQFPESLNSPLTPVIQPL